MIKKGKHNFLDINYPLKDQDSYFKKVTISHDYWHVNDSLMMLGISTDGSIITNTVID